MACCRPMVRWWHPTLWFLPSPAAPRFSCGSGFTTSPPAPAPLGRSALRCCTACTPPGSEAAVLGTRSRRRSAPRCPPRTDGERVPPCCRPCLPPSFSPLFATTPVTSPPSPLPPVPHGLPLWGLSPRLPAGCDGGPPAPRWACVIWPGRSRVHHPVAVPNWRLYSAYLGRPCGGSATSWFGAGLFCFNRLGPWN